MTDASSVCLIPDQSLQLHFLSSFASLFPVVAASVRFLKYSYHFVCNGPGACLKCARSLRGARRGGAGFRRLAPRDCLNTAFFCLTEPSGTLRYGKQKKPCRSLSDSHLPHPARLAHRTHARTRAAYHNGSGPHCSCSSPWIRSSTHDFFQHWSSLEIHLTKKKPLFEFKGFILPPADFVSTHLCCLERAIVFEKRYWLPDPVH